MDTVQQQLTTGPASVAIPLLAGIGAAASPGVARGMGGLLTGLNMATQNWDKAQQRKRLSEAVGNIVGTGTMPEDATKILTAGQGAPELAPQLTQYALGMATPQNHFFTIGDTPVLASATRGGSNVRLSEVMPTEQLQGYLGAADERKKAQQQTASDITLGREMTAQQPRLALTKQMHDESLADQNKRFYDQLDWQKQRWDEQWNRQMTQTNDTQAKAAFTQAQQEQRQMLAQLQQLNTQRNKAIADTADMSKMPGLMMQYGVDLPPNATPAQKMQVARSAITNMYNNQMQGLVDQHTATMSPLIANYNLQGFDLPAFKQQVMQQFITPQVQPAPQAQPTTQPAKRWGSVILGR